MNITNEKYQYPDWYICPEQFSMALYKRVFCLYTLFSDTHMIIGRVIVAISFERIVHGHKD